MAKERKDKLDKVLTSMKWKDTRSLERWLDNNSFRYFTEQTGSDVFYKVRGFDIEHYYYCKVVKGVVVLERVGHNR